MVFYTNHIQNPNSIRIVEQTYYHTYLLFDITIKTT